MTITELPAAAPTPGSDVTAHLPVLLLGLRWLYDTEQPATATARSDGQALPSAGGRTLRFIPRGHPGGTVVRIEHARPAAGPQALPAAELDAFANLLDDLDVGVARSWIEYPGASGCFALHAPAHPTLCAAVARYELGCAVHPRDMCTCTEIEQGHAAFIDLAQLQHHAIAAGATIPALAGPWPHYLDPSGVLGRAVPLHPLSANVIGGPDASPAFA